MAGPERERDEDEPYFGKARKWSGFGILGAAIAYVLIGQSFPSARPPDPIILGLLVATGLGLLAVEGASSFLRR